MNVHSNSWPGQAPSAARFKVIAMGASAGGLEPVMAILQALPVTFPVPIILVLHIPERRESGLVEVLSKYSKVPVRQAEDKAPVRGGAVYVAGPSYHVSVEKNHRFSLSDELPQQFSRPSIDVLFRSVADAYGRAALAVLLSGASADGAMGLASIKENRGTTLVQKPENARFALMPLAALKLHQPDGTLTVEELKQFFTALGGTASE